MTGVLRAGVNATAVYNPTKQSAPDIWLWQRQSKDASGARSSHFDFVSQASQSVFKDVFICWVPC